MNISIRYWTEYRYESDVSFSPHVFRLFPKADTHITVERLVFETNEGAQVQYRRDLFDNVVASCFYPDRFPALWVRLAIDLQLHERNPFQFLLASHAVDFPFSYEPHEKRVLEPFLQPLTPRVELPFWKLQPKPTLDALLELNRALFENLHYERREEGAALLPSEMLAVGGGACRDFAVLLAETLRGLGVAARLASGYLWEQHNEGEKRAEGALHAWTEAYLPGAGWVGLDPANGVFCNHHHITAAVGLTFEDIAPISGHYYADRHVPSEMSVTLELSERQSG